MYQINVCGTAVYSETNRKIKGAGKAKRITARQLTRRCYELMSKTSRLELPPKKQWTVQNLGNGFLFAFDN